MHTTIAAGKFLEVRCDDATKTVPVSFKVVDPVEKQKCIEGVYTGLSIGGDYVKRWKDPERPGVFRYTAKLAEGSLVDNPCMYGATFQLVRAAGAEPELAKFAGAVALEKVKPLEGALQKLAALKKDDVPAEAAAPAAAAIEGLAAVKAKLQEVLSNFALLPTDRTTFEMHELIDALSRLDYAGYTARQIQGEAMLASPAADDDDKKKSGAASGDGSDAGNGNGGGGGSGGGGGTGGHGGGAIMNQGAQPGDVKKDVSRDATPAAAADKKESPDAAKAEDASAIARSVNDALKSHGELLAKIADALTALKDGPKALDKSVGEAVEKAMTASRESLEALSKRLEKVEATPAAIGTPAQPVNKALGGAPVGDATPLNADAITKVLSAVKGLVPESVHRELVVQMATAAMPR